MTRGFVSGLVLTGALLPAVPAAAQDTVVVRRDTVVMVTRPTGTVGDIERWAVDVFNAPRTTRVFGPLRVESGSTIPGDLAVLDGPLIVYGTITGDLVGINADITLESGAVVEGDVVVLGGRLDAREGARIEGSSRWHREGVDVRRDGDRLELRGRRHDTRYDRERGFDDRDRSRAFLVLGLGGTYNRVEGLPMRGGAGIEWWSGGMGGRIRGYGVFRTAGRFTGSREDIGYNVEGRLRFGATTPRLTLDARAFDVVVPTQGWPLTLHEVGWGTFLWHRDYRDYFLQRGFSGALTFEPARDVALIGEVRVVDEASITERDPWTPFRGDEPWRANPVIDAGDYVLFAGTIRYDSRGSLRSRYSGTLLEATWEHGRGDDIVENALPTTVRPALPAADYRFDRASVDLRRYQRIGRAGQLRVRGFWAGALGGDPLPIQRRYALGGPDPLNGYAFRAFNCNPLADAAQTALCDHVLLFQAEYRGGFGIEWLGHERSSHRRRTDERAGDWDGWDWDWDWDDWDWFGGPHIVLFTNAGTGWLRGSDGPGRLNWDVGAGLAFGSVGVYFAKALREGEPVRVTLRIERRF